MEMKLKSNVNWHGVPRERINFHFVNFDAFE